VPVLAQVRAALVQNRDEPSRNFYRQNLGTLGSQPTLTLPAVPPGKRLIIQHVNLGVFTTVPDSIQQIFLDNSAGGVSYFPATYMATASGLNDYVVNESVLVNFEAGDVPKLQIFSISGGNTSVLGQISGYMIDVP
jgi:hypothetical protein